jgi:hypothetical protein
MPKCGNTLCGAEVGKLTNGLCGLCDCTLNGRAPGHVGRDHRNEADPDWHDAGKEMELGMRGCEERGEIDSATAERWKRGLLAQYKSDSEWRNKNRKEIEASNREQDQLIRDQEANIQSETKRAKHDFIAAVENAKNVGALS